LSCADEKAPHPFRRAHFFLFVFFCGYGGRGRGGASIGECPMFQNNFDGPIKVASSKTKKKLGKTFN
jgi:hypothetical protein